MERKKQAEAGGFAARKEKGVPADSRRRRPNFLAPF
jgi:hypothetical protein